MDLTNFSVGIETPNQAPTSTPSISPKAPISQKKLEANRKNAVKSTGPKTEAGKERSRRNGLKHGLAGKGIVLLEDDQGLIDDRLADWATDLKPGNSVEQYLVLQAVTASVQLDRATLQESADRVDRIRSAQDDWDEARAAEVRDLLRDLPGQGRQIAPRLRRSALGCQQMIDHWERLHEALERDEETRSHIFPSWSPAQFQLALDLLGVDVQDPAGKAVQYFHRVLGDYQRLETLAKPASTVTQEEVLLRQEEIRQQPEVYEALRELIATQITSLEADRDRIAEEIDGPSRNEAPQRVLVDLTKRGDLLRRYQTTHSTALHRSLNQYTKLVKTRRADPAPFIWNDEARDEANETRDEANEARDEANEARDEANEPAPPNSQPPAPSPHSEEVRDEANKLAIGRIPMALLGFLFLLLTSSLASAEVGHRSEPPSTDTVASCLQARDEAAIGDLSHEGVSDQRAGIPRPLRNQGKMLACAPGSVGADTADPSLSSQDHGAPCWSIRGVTSNTPARHNPLAQKKNPAFSRGF